MSSMPKSKDTILNEMVSNTVELVKRKIDYIEFVAQQFEEKDQLLRARSYRKDAKEMKTVIKILTKWSGCWA